MVTLMHKLRLLQRITLQRVGSFGNILITSQIRKGADMDTGRQHRLHFGDFVPVMGGKYQIHLDYALKNAAKIVEIPQQFHAKRIIFFRSAPSIL